MRKTLPLALILLLASVTARSQKKMSAGDYIDRYKDLAIEQMILYRIPASIKLAQGLLESGNGGSRLAVEANNHFGIKCKTGWGGERIYHDDDERGECFRCYLSPRESYVDHSVFLASSSRYEQLFRLDITDYQGWARGLKACGYATNPDYAAILIRLIENYKLYEFDRADGLAQRSDTPAMVSSAVNDPDDSRPENTTSADRREWGIAGGVRYMVVRAGDDFKALAREAGISSGKLMRYNDLDHPQVPKAGDVLYVSRKKKRASNFSEHYVRSGETTRSIAQEYAVTVKALKKMNPQLLDAPPYVGQNIRLR